MIHCTKRRQRASTPCDGASKVPMWAPSSWSVAGAVLPSRVGEGRAGRPESKSMRTEARGVPQELGRSFRVHGPHRQGVRRTQRPPVSRWRVWHQEERTPGRTAWYRRAKATKSGGTAGSRSAVIVLEKRGNGPRLDPVKGSAASNHGPVAGTHGKGIEPWFRVNATATDNVSGRESMVQETVCTHACTYGSVGAPGG